MNRASPTARVFLFGAFLLEQHGGGLFQIDSLGVRKPVRVGSRALDVLAVLAERRGQAVSKDEIMNAVWPDTAVEDGNLTVQVSALRRVLDRDRSGGSYIQTVPGRGYRLAEPVRLVAMQPDAKATVGNDPGARAEANGAPRLSIAVLPFQNLSGGSTEDRLCNAVTDDLTSELSRISDAFVIARAAAYAFWRKAEDIRGIGAQLGVRHAVAGSLHRIGTILRVNVQLVAAETGANVWSDRFDVPMTDLAACEDAIVRRVGPALAIEVVDAESIRSARERPANPDAFDLVLRARSLQNQPFSTERNEAAQTLYEQALAVHPMSLRAVLGLLRVLVSRFNDGLYWSDGDAQQRVFDLHARALSIAPHDEDVLTCTVRLLDVQQKWHQLMVAAQDLIDNHPNNVYGYLYLARGKIASGDAEEALPLLMKTIELNPRDPYLWDRYWRMGFALQLIGRYQDSIVWHRRALSVYPDVPPFLHSNRLRHMASAWALDDKIKEASGAIAEAQRLWPFATVRSCSLLNPSSDALVTQMRRYQEGLRIAGLRDHAEEDADFGVVPDNVLHPDLTGFTPRTIAGASAIRTMELQTLLTEQRQSPVVVDTAFNSWGYSVPGAVGLKHSGGGGNLADSTQNRLRRKMHVVTAGDLDRPVVAVGCNSECFDGYNLALRLAALGYRNVHWYRGGREAWEVNRLPQREIDLQEW